MTPQQVELARHALGLTNGQRRSYRNRFLIAEGSDLHDAWSMMVIEGDAMRHKIEGHGGNDLFCLSRKGAEKALKKGEKLDPEDFPEPKP